MSQITALEPSLRERKRRATHQRIADEAARLVAAKGLEGTTIDEIAAAAQVARATFFRYFDTKETAVAEGFSIPWLQLIIDNLLVQPAELDALGAVIETFAGFAGDMMTDEVRALVLHQAQMSQASPTLQAWSLALLLRYELAIADAVRPRFSDLLEDDPRPRLVGAITMSSIRISLDLWLETGGTKDLGALLQCALRSVRLPVTTGQPVLQTRNPGDATL